LEDAFTKAMKEPSFIKGMKDLRFSIAFRNNIKMDNYPETCVKTIMLAM
jgi:hypothetical protein